MQHNMTYHLPYGHTTDLTYQNPADIHYKGRRFNEDAHGKYLTPFHSLTWLNKIPLPLRGR